MDKTNTIGTTAGFLMGAGTAVILQNLNTGLILIGVGTFLAILVSYLRYKGLDVQSAPLG